MSANPSQRPSDAALAERIARLEERIAQIEARLTPSTPAPLSSPLFATPPTETIDAARQSVSDEEIEYEVGQNWFARVGIVVLAIGGIFMLSLPYSGLPAIVPTLIGYGVTAALFLLADGWQRRFGIGADYFRAVGMALLWFATLRLAFFGNDHALNATGLGLPLLLAGGTAVNLAVAFRRRTPWLITFALGTGYASGLAVPSAAFVLLLILALAAVVVVTEQHSQWSMPTFTATLLGPLVYFNWSLGDLVHSGAVHAVTSPVIAPVVLLITVLGLALGTWRRLASNPDPIFAAISAFLNCAFGYGAFLIHTGAAFPGGFIPAHVLASIALLGLAVVFCTQAHHHASTFFYAMTAYLSLTAAIIKASEVPNVFVWLSAQSLVVVATAVWFRSRFIVVANFAIFVATVLGYVILKGRETGISLGIGIVALVSARILNWQKDRLELKTELMRNAYLISGFIVFPYALYHLVPSGYVGLAWVGLGLVYYGLNLIVRSPKYRWMGHATLLLTTGYLVLVGTRSLDPVYRVVSFLALGTVLLIVSLTFSRLRSKERNRVTPGPATS